MNDGQPTNDQMPVEQTEPTSIDQIVQSINDLVKQTYELAKSQGKYDIKPNVAPLLMHTIGEVNEAHIAFASGNRSSQEDVAMLKYLMEQGKDSIFRKYFKSTVKSTFEDELADIALMVFSMAGYYGVDLGNHIILKLNYNKLRSEHSATNNYDK